MLKQSTARNLSVFLTDSTDHVTGKTGLTLTITASKDGAAFGSITPTVTELNSGWYSLALTTTHTNTLGDFLLHITGTGTDPSDVREQVVLDLPGVAQTGDNYARLGAPVGASVSADVAGVKAVLPAALVSGRIDASVGAMAANVLTATAINADAITDAKVAADVTIASVIGAVGSVTGNVGGNVVGSVASVTARVTANIDQLAGQTVTAAAGVTFPTSVASPTNITAGTITTATNLTNAPTSGDFTAAMKTSLDAATPAVTVSDKTGFSLSAGGVQAIWDALTSALTTAGSIGKWIVDKLDVVLSTRLASSGYTAPLDAAGTRSAVGLASANLDTQLDALPTATENADAVWDEAIAGHAGAGSTGEALSNAGAAGTPPSASDIADEVATRTIAAVDLVNGLAANTLTAAALASDAVTEIQSGLSTLNAAGVRTAIGLGSANLDTQLSGVPAAILAAIVEGSLSVNDFLVLIGAALLGKTAIVATGDGTATVTFRNASDTADAIVGTQVKNVAQSGSPAERTEVTLNP